MKSVKNLFRCISFLLLALVCTGVASAASVKGTVVDDTGEPLIGVTVVLKGDAKVMAATDFDGNYSLNVPDPDKGVLVFSYVGMDTQEVKIAGRSTVNVTMSTRSEQLDEVVVVGYGQQKKMSIVGSIAQTSGEVLERAGGVTSVGSALTGNLPGVITYSSTGMPGEEDPKIIIRSQSSWNSSDPLVLVDGIERDMSSVDITSVENISVLKDASATAVYGVKGANGVILITTKRGKEGKASVHAKVNMTAKVVSKLPKKYDAYDTFLIRNNAMERELLIPGLNSWNGYQPMEIIDKYRNPLNDEEWDRYPNVDWEDYLFKKTAFSYNASVDVSGGTKLVTYFAAVNFIHEGDQFKTFKNGRGYDTGFGFNRINVRSNLDFKLTPTTKLSVNLFGSNGQRHLPWDMSDSDGSFWNSAYKTAPDAMRPVYSDGTWGWYAPRDADVPNSAYNLAHSGLEKRTTTKINTDSVLNQELDMVTKGLRFQGRFALDYSFLENKRGINDLYHDAQRMWVNPDTGEIDYKLKTDAGTQLDPSNSIYWTTAGGAVDVNKTFRKVYYAFQLDYARKFGLHEVSAMGAFNREDYAQGSEFHHYREDWVFRATYNFDARYFAEFNGAYNGSEKFGPNHRFDFFPSASIGWRLSGEPFMKDITWIDQIKFRGSWGKVGDDNAGGRWLYQNQWVYGGNTIMGMVNPANSPYTYYRISQLGNPDIGWEKVEKRNIGLDYGFLNGLVAGSLDFFSDKRTDILVSGSSRAIPSYFGANAPTANLGRVDSKGYELELRLNYPINRDMRVWGNFNMTHATNEIKFRDDAPLLPDYLKQAGHSIGQTTSYVDYGTITNWDDLYGTTRWGTMNNNKLPGDYKIIDFNGDGVIDTYDKIPYGYSGVPQNTYNASVGFEWKGLSLFVQFYGVTNVTREVRFPTFQNSSNVAFVEGDYWTPLNSGLPHPRWSSQADPAAAGTRYLYDASYCRLKNAEISYNLPSKWLRKVGINTCRVFLNGDNLFLWTKMPDDRESNFSGDSTNGAYPTVRRFNIGVDITL